MTLPSESKTQERVHAPRNSTSAGPTSTTRVQRRGGVPTRTCIGCRKTFPSAELFRCRVDGHSSAVVAVEQMPSARHGRGAWVCGPECAAVAIGKRAFDRSFRRSVDTSGLLEAIRVAHGNRLVHNVGPSGTL